MPKVIGHTPPWLSRPSPGAKIFADPTPQSPMSSSKRASPLASPSSAGGHGPRRLVATRGTEIFTVVGNKIRWADLTAIRDDWEENAQSGGNRFGLSRNGDAEIPEDHLYRILDVAIYYQICQIVLSPSGAFLAICTEHTVHVAVLPPPTRLRDQDRAPLKLKTYQLGPTIHVIPESQLSSVLWHPLAPATPSTDCIVTVTAEAAVRVWEIDRANKWSFERPALAIDLRKLADGVSCDQTFEPSGFGKTRGFSVDDFDMEVAAACFGGRGQDDEDAWASMTLWTAMRNGDLYALCPLVPSRWKPTPTTIPSLSTAAVARMATRSSDDDATADQRRAADQQYEWIQEIDDQGPLLVDPDDGAPFEVRLRPLNPSAIPRLQGPFTLQADDDVEDLEISDLMVFAAKIDGDDLYDGEDDTYDVDRTAYTGVPFTTVCVATTDHALWFALDLEGVSGEWLPKQGRTSFVVPTTDAQELCVIDTVTLKGFEPASPALTRPVLTSDIVHHYCLFVTTAHHTYSFSLNDWITRLAAELSGSEPVDPALKTRLETSCQSPVCVTGNVVAVTEPTDVLSAPALVDDLSLGYLLIATTASAAHVVFFDQTYLRASMIGPSPPVDPSSSTDVNAQLIHLTGADDATDFDHLPARAPYAPSKVLYANQLYPLESMRQRLPPALKKAVSESPMRLSPAMLEIMTVAHRTVGTQSAELEKAAAELFRRCERLRAELADQVKQMSELALRLHRLQSGSDDGDHDEGHTTPASSHAQRIKDAQEKQVRLVTRYEALRRKVGRVNATNHDLSAKEIAWIEETAKLSKMVGADGDKTSDEAVVEQRYEKAKQLVQELVDESKRLPQQHPPPSLDRQDSTRSTSSLAGSKSSPLSTSTFGVSSRLQKERIADVMAMVERESAIIDAVMKRLERLQVES